MSWDPDRTSTRAQQAARQVVLARANFRCQIRDEGCIGVATVADHIQPLAEGGADTLTNQQAACVICHHHKTSAEAARGKARQLAKTRRPKQKHPGMR